LGINNPVETFLIQIGLYISALDKINPIGFDTTPIGEIQNSN
jgi:hypothetical protein